MSNDTAICNATTCSNLDNDGGGSNGTVAAGSFVSTNLTILIYGVIFISLIMLLIVACCLRLRYDRHKRARYAYESEFDIRKELKRAAKKATKLKEREALFEAARKSGVPLHVIMSAQREKRREKRPVVFARRQSMSANARLPANGHEADIDENDEPHQHDENDESSASSDDDTNSQLTSMQSHEENGMRPLPLDAAIIK